MANGHGGYRAPANPAPVSGPGAHSQRTDGRQPVMSMPDAAYGEDANFRALQGAAPLPQATLSGPVGGPTPPAPGPSIVGLGEPSTMPGTPVTDGAEYGAGAGPTALGLPANPNQADAQWLGKYLPHFIAVSNSDDAPPGFKQWVRNIIANS